MRAEALSPGTLLRFGDAALRVWAPAPQDPFAPTFYTEADFRRGSAADQGGRRILLFRAAPGVAAAFSESDGELRITANGGEGGVLPSLEASLLRPLFTRRCRILRKGHR